MFCFILLFLLIGCESKDISPIKWQDTPENLLFKFFKAELEGDCESYIECLRISDGARRAYELDYELVQLLHQLYGAVEERFGQGAWDKFRKLKIGRASNVLIIELAGVNIENLVEEVQKWEFTQNDECGVWRKSRELTGSMFDSEIKVEKRGKNWYVVTGLTDSYEEILENEIKIYQATLDYVDKPGMTLLELKKFKMETEDGIY